MVGETGVCRECGAGSRKAGARTGARELTVKNDIWVGADVNAVAGAAADALVAAVQATPNEQIFSLALSGGETPQVLFRLLAQPPYREALPWQRLHFFWGDERVVPEDDPQSNAGRAKELLLAHVPVPDGNVHAVPTNLADVRQISSQYEAELRRHFRTRADELPRFDLVFLGMGADGHTASLFPGTEALEETRRWVVPNWVPSLGAYRITLTFRVFNQAARVLVLACGQSKRAVLRQVLDGSGQFPIQCICPVNGRLRWLVDEAAYGERSRQ